MGFKRRVHFLKLALFYISALFFLSEVKKLIFLKENLIFSGFLEYTFPYLILYISLFYIFLRT